MNDKRSHAYGAGLTALVAATALLFAACGSDSGSASTTAAPTTVTPTTVQTSSPATAATEGTTAEVVTTDVSSTEPEASTGAPASGEPYQLAFIADSTGGFAALGTNGLAGFTAAVQAINESGGANGHPLEIKAIDSQTTPDGMQAAGLQAVEAKPVAIAGCVLSSQVPVLANTIGEAAIPTLVGCSNNEALVHPVTPWYYQISADSQNYADGLVAAASSLFDGSLTGKKVAIVGLTSAGVDGILAATGPAIEAAGGSVVTTERTALGLASFDAQAANMVATEPDVVYIIDQTASSVISAKALRSAGFEGPIILADGSAADVVMEQIGSDDVYGMRFVIPPVQGSDAYKAAEAAGVLDSISDQGFSKTWVAAHLIAAGLEQCGFPCDPAGLTKALDSLASVDVADVTTGPVGFSADNHVGVRSLVLYRWDLAKGVSEPFGEPTVFRS